MHYLVIGKTGQLARAIQSELDGSDHTATYLDRTACNLSASENMVLSAIDPHLSSVDAIIIAAAYTAVDQAEADYDTALAVNGRAPGVIAKAAASANLPVVHVSTDYVFDGQATMPYPTDMPVDPLNAYGRSKAEGEKAVRDAQPRSAVLRTSWVYDGTGKNFMTTMLRLGETRDALSVVADQIGRPTYARDLAKACLSAADALVAGETAAAGIFHVSNSGDPISWADFARAIFEATTDERDHTLTVTDIPSSEFPTPAKRPAYSVMELASFESAFDFALPDWQSGLERALTERAS